MIETCPICAGIGIIFQSVYPDLELIAGQGTIPHFQPKEIQVTCPNCKGQKQLRTGGEWTLLKDLPHSLLYDLVKLRALVEEDKGKVTFVADQNIIDMTDETLLALLSECSRVGKLMQEHNWLVIY